MLIAVIGYDGFTDVDLFLPFDFFFRVKVSYGAAYEGDWNVRILSDREWITSYSGNRVGVHGRLEQAREADAVFIVSGDGSRAKLEDPVFMDALQLDPSRQIIAAIDSGVLILAALGHLHGLSATTYPPVMPEVEAMGVRTEMRPLVVHGNIGTGGGCLAAMDLCSWVVARLLSGDAAAKVRASFEPNGH